jgi:hypothetical protein
MLAKGTRLQDTTHKKQSMHVKIVPTMGTYLPKKSTTASFFVPARTIIAVKLIMERFDCKVCGYQEYVGCKIERTENSLKFTQPVLVQSYSDEFELPTRIHKTPAQIVSVLVADKKVEALSLAMQKKYCSGAGKAVHAMKYSKPETYNALQDLS